MRYSEAGSPYTDEDLGHLISDLEAMGDRFFVGVFKSFAWHSVHATSNEVPPVSWSRQPIEAGTEGMRYLSVAPNRLHQVLIAYMNDAPRFLRSAVLERVVVDMLVFAEYRTLSLQLAGRLELKSRRRLALLGLFSKKMREMLPRAETASKLTYVALRQASIEWSAVKRIMDAARDEGVGWRDVLTDFVDWLADEEAQAVNEQDDGRVRA